MPIVANAISPLPIGFDSLSLDGNYAELAKLEQEIERVAAPLKRPHPGLTTIAVAESIVKDLVRRKCELKTRINHVNSSFIRSLPIEIAFEIFHWIIAPFADEKGQEIFSSTPLFLGTICSTWRKVAWETPALWASLTFRIRARSVNTDAKKPPRAKIQLLDEWLRRSRDVPLSLRVVLQLNALWKTSNAQAALEVMKTFSARWSNLDLRIPTHCYSLLPLPAESPPLLKSLHLSQLQSNPQNHDLTLDMSNSARIHHLSLCDVYLISVKFQWDQVTDLKLQSYYPDECLEVMRRTPQLVSCTLQNIIYSTGPRFPAREACRPLFTLEAPVHLPYLMTLSIQNKRDTPPLGPFFDKMSSPNLKHFSYSGVYFIDCAPLCALISRSGLQTFYLRAVRDQRERQHHCIIASLQMKEAPGIYSVS